MIVGLVGLPGSGKSSVARLLGQHYGWDADDTDSVIETHLGCPIREYFDSQGESAFRDVETRVLREQVERSGPLILATGGGIVLRQENRELLRRRCLVFYLRSTPEELARRLRYDSKRPLLQGVDALRKLRELSAVRDPLYRQAAHYVVDANRPTIWGLVHWICMQLELGGHIAPPNRLGA